MNFGRRTILALGLLGTTLAGGVLGATVFAPGVSGAQSTSTTTPAATAAPSGTFKPNENATHEAGESAAREAQENAGEFPTVP